MSKWNKLFSVILAVFVLAPSPVTAGSPGITPGRKWSTLERMSAERIAAADADVAKLKAARVEVGTKTGLNDYHCILHAHAEDSQHTAGTLPEMLEDAKKVGVDCIMLTDHFRPPKDYMDGWRGLRDGVLFIPGSETHGALVYPEKSIMDKMDLGPAEIVPAVTEGEGLIFLSHIESKLSRGMDGMTGLEIYNNHYDAMEDAAMMMALIGKMTDPKSVAELQKGLEEHPAPLYAALVDPLSIYLKKWDDETQKFRLTGVAANDCHHNQVYIVKMVDAENVRVGTVVDPDEDMRVVNGKGRPGVLELIKGHQPGDELVRLDFDTYARSFMNCATHILAPELTEPAIRTALKAGHAYVSHDWMCDPTGFAYMATVGGQKRGIMGDDVSFVEGLKLVAEFPAECKIRVIKNGVEAGVLQGRMLEQPVDGPGVYRVEGWLTVDTEERPWIYSNPIYVR